jgi:hypothetical protein
MVIDLLTEADIQTRASRRRRRTPGLFKAPSSPFFDIDILIGVQDFDRSVQTLIVAGFVSSRAASGLRPAGHTACGNTRPHLCQQITTSHPPIGRSHTQVGCRSSTRVHVPHFPE